ncbi:MAG: RNA polymerase sigma factor [Caulobacteraceae bacterium]
MTRVTDERARWLARFVLPHEPALRAWLSRRPVRGLDPDDIIQEAYAKLVAMPSVEAIRDPRSYLFQIAKSVIGSHLRSRKVVTITVSDLDLLDLAAEEPSAEVQVSDREELQRLAQAIAALPEPTRTIFRLRRIEQLPQRAIAERLRMPESTVEKHVSRAFLAMSNLLGRGGTRRLHASSRRVELEQAEDEVGDGTRD